MATRAETADRARLSREAVVDRAMELVQAEGMDALTIRRLAKDLGVTPMALYWHFKNKDELVVGMADRFWSLVDIDLDESAPWEQQLRGLMNSVITVLRRYPAVVHLIRSDQIEKTTSCFRVIETALGVFQRAGFDLSRASWLCNQGLHTAVFLVSGEPGASIRQCAEDPAEAFRRKRLELESLPRADYPLMVAAAPYMAGNMDPEEHYRMGVDLFCAGVAAIAPG